MTVLDRVRVRIPESEAEEALLSELITTVKDRIGLRICADKIPEKLESIVVDATVKMFRRCYYEGISSESVASLETTFVDDILAEYDDELSAYKDSNAIPTGKVVRFL